MQRCQMHGSGMADRKRHAQTAVVESSGKEGRGAKGGTPASRVLAGAGHVVEAWGLEFAAGAKTRAGTSCLVRHALRGAGQRAQ